MLTKVLYALNPTKNGELQNDLLTFPLMFQEFKLINLKPSQKELAFQY